MKPDENDICLEIGCNSKLVDGKCPTPENHMRQTFEYKVVQADKAYPATEYIIEKTGLKKRFSVAEILDAKKSLDKQKREISGKRMIHDAKVKNIESNHPFIHDMSAEQLFTAHMYQSEQASLTICDEGLKTIADYEAAYDEELARIKEATGIEAPKAGEAPTGAVAL